MPTVLVTGGTFAYHGQPHAVRGYAHGVGGTSDLLTPTLIFTYNGSGSVPIAAKTCNVLFSFAGNSNYIPVTNTAMLTITSKIYKPLVARNGSWHF